jgi:hypothetical protein
MRLRVLLAWALVWGAANPLQARNLEAGIAFTDAALMQELDGRGLSLGAMLSPGWQRGAATPVVNNRQLSAIPALKTLLGATNRRLVRCSSRDITTGVGIACLKRLFDRSYLYASFARFELVGVVNRMDRAWNPRLPCGEVRLLYRLAYATTTREGPTRSRLPMTLNLVMKTKDAADPSTCAAIARRWLDAGEQIDARPAVPPGEFANRLLGPGGPLALIDPALIDRIETNIQSLRQPATIVPAFGGNAEYQLAVYRYNPATRVFDPQVMENQIDRERLLADPALLAALKAWLFEPQQMKALDHGIVDIPKAYLATTAISVAPGGVSRSRNRPFDGLVSDEEAQDALRRAAAAGVKLANMSSAYGVQRRLDDITCVGCHQSRAIGGFHFMGADRRENLQELPANAIFVPGSAHFYGEAPRRRAIVEAMAEGRTPDYLRSFSARPRKSLAAGLTGTGIHNGWGATCYKGEDKSFKAWTCADGLVCRALHESDADPGMGLCVTRGRPKVGDAVEFGRVITAGYGSDMFARTTPRPGAALVPPQVDIDTRSHAAAPQKGGFLGGMVRTRTCEALPEEAICARAAGNGFNDCLGDGHNFETCVTQHTNLEGLRVCDQLRPCRDDYICVATNKKGRGACLPPYFLFQFRVDGHPLAFNRRASDINLDSPS